MLAQKTFKMFNQNQKVESETDVQEYETERAMKNIMKTIEKMNLGTNRTNYSIPLSPETKKLTVTNFNHYEEIKENQLNRRND